MIRKEINEIKAQYTLENCGILKICGCYVDGEKNKVTKIDQTFLNLPDEEKHKYFDIFRKTLSGTPQKNLLTMEFEQEAYEQGGKKDQLKALLESGLKDQALLDDFYDRMITHYSYPGNYLILLIHQVYDVPKKTTDDLVLEDASDEVYPYILCSVCHVTLSKPGLGYDEEQQTFKNQLQNHMVELPDVGFLFPAFTDRTTDEDHLLFYSKDADQFQQEIMHGILGCTIPLPAADQKQTFQEIVEQTLGDDCNYETVRNIHKNLNEIVEEQKQSPKPATLDKKEVRQLLENSGVKEERLEKFESHFDQAVGENTTLVAANLAKSRSFEVRTPDVIVRVSPDKTDLIETRIVDGRPCLVIPIDEQLEVNGIMVNAQTGEVIESTQEL